MNPACMHCNERRLGTGPSLEQRVDQGPLAMTLCVCGNIAIEEVQSACLVCGPARTGRRQWMAPQRHYSLQDKKSVNDSPGSDRLRQAPDPSAVVWLGNNNAPRSPAAGELCMAGNELHCQSECVLQQLRLAAATSLTNPSVAAAPVCNHAPVLHPCH